MLDPSAGADVLKTALERRESVTVSVQTDGAWSVFKTHLMRFDPEQGVLQIAYPASDGSQAVEIVAGQTIGVAFRRGHKKCLFTTVVVTRQRETGSMGEPIDTLVAKMPDQIREVQRRAYHRIMVPADQFIAVKIWEGGAPSAADPSWPVCSGRLGNASVGGILLDVRVDQNPRLSIGDIVGVEITMTPGQPPLIAEAQYRHCATTSNNRLGLGFQFVGLEHGLPGRASLDEVAEFVRDLKKAAGRREPHRQRSSDA